MVRRSLIQSLLRQRRVRQFEERADTEQ